MSHRRLRYCQGLFLLLGYMLASSLMAVDRLEWRSKDNRVSADIKSWDLQQTLGKVAAATGWEVYVEPGAKREVSVRFKDLTPQQALQRLLGNLNFALLPRTNSPARLLVYRNSATDATQAVWPAKVKIVPNELIVTLKPGMKVEDLAKQLGAKVSGRIGSANAYRLQFEDEDAAKNAKATLANNSDVSAEYNYYVDRPDMPELLGANNGLPFNLSPKAAADGSGVIIGLIDTGLQSLDPKYSQFLLKGISVAGESQLSNLYPSHGTSMAEIILQAMAANSADLAVAAHLLPVDVYGNSETTTTFDVANGISLAVEQGADIINLSLSSDGDSAILETVIRNSAEQGILFLGAAGNQPVATPTYPASYPEVIAVTAGDSRGNLAPYANYGAFVDVAAPGTSLVPFNGQSWMVSGTSTSTAYVTGVAAATAVQTGKPMADVGALIRERLRVRTTKP